MLCVKLHLTVVLVTFSVFFFSSIFQDMTRHSTSTYKMNIEHPNTRKRISKSKIFAQPCKHLLGFFCSFVFARVHFHTFRVFWRQLCPLCSSTRVVGNRSRTDSVHPTWSIDCMHRCFDHMHVCGCPYVRPRNGLSSCVCVCVWEYHEPLFSIKKNVLVKWWNIFAYWKPSIEWYCGYPMFFILLCLSFLLYFGMLFVNNIRIFFFSHMSLEFFYIRLLSRYWLLFFFYRIL